MVWDPLKCWVRRLCWRQGVTRGRGRARHGQGPAPLWTGWTLGAQPLLISKAPVGSAFSFGARVESPGAFFGLFSQLPAPAGY